MGTTVATGTCNDMEIIEKVFKSSPTIRKPSGPEVSNGITNKYEMSPGSPNGVYI